jgi:hypothetical protein
MKLGAEKCLGESVDQYGRKRRRRPKEETRHFRQATCRPIIYCKKSVGVWQEWDFGALMFM